MTASELESSPAQQHKTHARRRVVDGASFGLIAHLDDDRQAWIAVSPRACNPRLERSVVARTETGQDHDATWSVTCFYSHHQARGQGIEDPSPQSVGPGTRCPVRTAYVNRMLRKHGPTVR